MSTARPVLSYDAERGPRGASWREAGEAARLAAVEAHHRTLGAAHPPTPKPRLHAAIHLVVETQLASGEPPEVRLTLARLVSEGLSRHEALHAIGSIVASVVHGALTGASFEPASFANDLGALSAERWRQGGGAG